MRRSSAPSMRLKQNYTGQRLGNDEYIRSSANILNLLENHLNSSTVISTNASTSFASSSTSSNSSGLESAITNKIIFSVVYGKISTRKHKTYEEDGTFEVNTTSKIGTLKDSNGKQIGRLTLSNISDVIVGKILQVGNNEFEVIDQLSVNEINILKRNIINTPASDDEDDQLDDDGNVQKKKKSNPSFVFKSNLILSNATTTTSTNVRRRPLKILHNINPIDDYEPLILPQPTYQHQWKYNIHRKPIADVIVMGCLARELRPHQRYGVQFLYECLMGFRTINKDILNSDGQCDNSEDLEPFFGCILADEMGLGKTLQCITCIYTLLKQGPYGQNVVNKVLIVTPSSLVQNWNNEIHKWLGRERSHTFQINEKHKIHEYKSANHIPFLLISYEMFTRHFDSLKDIKFDVVVCDEGHRLKNSTIKVAIQLNQLDCKRRIILTGTPIQNNLQEFYSLINFVNPNILGSYNEYKTIYENPIITSQESNILPCVRELGERRAQQLNTITQKFILRRTQDVIVKYLPKREEFIIFCRPSQLQRLLLVNLLKYYKHSTVNDNDMDTFESPLKIISLIKKICNHPALINRIKPEKIQNDPLMTYIKQFLPNWQEMSPEDSTKLHLIQILLSELIKYREKIVLVSNHTKTLDILQSLIEHYQYNYCRLDGKTNSGQRQTIVDRFNRQENDIFIFLLSAKAGGIGLNLIGASRLVLFDNDWNPSVDLQAMSRIWRDGQKKKVFIYRFITCGTIEEKIFQRQQSKILLSGLIVDQENPDILNNWKCTRSERDYDRKLIQFSPELLKDLFTISIENFDQCSSHQLLKCECLGNGQSEESTIDDANEENTTSSTYTIKTDELSTAPNRNRSSKSSEYKLWDHYKYPVNQDLLKYMCLPQAEEHIVFIYKNINSEGN